MAGREYQHLSDIQTGATKAIVGSNRVRREALEGFAWSGPRRAIDEATRAWLLARPAPSFSDLQRDKGKGKAKQ